MKITSFYFGKKQQDEREPLSSCSVVDRLSEQVSNQNAVVVTQDITQSTNQQDWTNQLVPALEIAIAAAVVGPPMFALEARMISSRLNLKILPKIRVMSILQATMMRAYTNSRGAWVMMLMMEAGAPITAKKM